MPETGSRPCARRPTHVGPYVRRNPRTGRHEPVRGYDREHAGGRRTVAAAGATTAGVTVAGSALAAATLSAEAAAAVCTALVIVGYQSFATWAGKRGVEMPRLRVPEGWGDGEVDARKVAARAQRVERRDRAVAWWRSTGWPATRRTPGQVRRFAQDDLVLGARLAGLAYHAFCRAWAPVRAPRDGGRG